MIKYYSMMNSEYTYAIIFDWRAPQKYAKHASCIDRPSPLVQPYPQTSSRMLHFQ